MLHFMKQCAKIKNEMRFLGEMRGVLNRSYSAILITGAMVRREE